LRPRPLIAAGAKVSDFRPAAVLCGAQLRGARAMEMSLAVHAAAHGTFI
jgi:hypothetical protein